MFWAFLLVTVLQYVAGVCFLQGCSQVLKDRPDISPEIRDQIEEYWCTVVRAMHSLFAACTGGANWYEMANPLHEAGSVYYGLFMVYIGFFILVVLNTLTSIFLQSTIEYSEQDHEMMIQRELEYKEDYVNLVSAFFDEIDDDGSGDLTLDEFRKHVGNAKLKAFATSMDIPIDDAEMFFRVLSNNGAVTVDIDTFVVGCIKLKGHARSVDLFGMYQMVKSVHRNLSQLGSKVEALTAKIQRQQVLLSALDHHDSAEVKDPNSQTDNSLQAKVDCAFSL